MHKYPADYKLIFVGDATMSPYEILYPGGSVEHFNEEAGSVWIQRLLSTYPKAAWLNPEPRPRWEDRMFPLTITGIDDCMRSLR